MASLANLRRDGTTGETSVIHGRGKKCMRVYVPMIGDLFHAGHVQLLKKAKQVAEVELQKLLEQSDEKWGQAQEASRTKTFRRIIADTAVIVGVIGDEEATKYRRRPILSINERIEVIGGCRFVDEVVVNAPIATTLSFMREHSLDFVVHGDDLSDVGKQRFYGEVLAAGRYREVSASSGMSTKIFTFNIRKYIEHMYIC